MSQASDTIIVGKIGAPYGVKGWAKINSYTEVPDGIFDYQPWILGDGKEYRIDEWRPHGKSLVAKLVGIDVMSVKANINDAFGQKERLLPVVFDDVVHSVDMAGKVIKVDWEPGF